MRSLMQFSTNEVSVALNRAADEILDAVDAPERGLRDALNLLVNAGIFYLTEHRELLAALRNHEPTLAEAIHHAYGPLEDEEGPLDWIREMLGPVQ